MCTDNIFCRCTVPFVFCVTDDGNPLFPTGSVDRHLPRTTLSHAQLLRSVVAVFLS